MTQDKTIAIIGAGQMGSRLLQGLLAMQRGEVARGLQVHVVDPSEASRQTAYNRAREIVDREGTADVDEIILHEGSSGLPDQVDLLLLAATSHHRFANLEDALAQTRPGMILLEKFLFDRRDQYAKAANLVEAEGIKAYVHCPRCYWPVYQAEQARLSETGQRAFVRVSGHNYALASNGVHFLDLARFLNGDSVCNVDIREGARPALNKREGYREILGALEADDAIGPVAELICEDGESVSLMVSLEAPDSILRIEETGGRWTRLSPTGTIMDKGAFAPVFASDNSAVFSDLLAGAPSPLPTLSESTAIHLAFFDALFPLLGTDDGDLPVT